MTDAPLSLTPEDRGRHHGAARRRLDRKLARLRPLAFGWEILKRALVGVWTDGFIHAGNLAYLALMTVFPFFIVAAAVASLFGQSDEVQRGLASFLSVLPRDVAAVLRTPIANVLQARTGPFLWFGALVGLWTVGSFAETIRDIFRRAYGTRSSQSLWRARLGLSMAIIASVVIALFAFLVQGIVTAAEQFIYRLLPLAQHVAEWLNLARAVPAAVMFGALYMLFLSVTPGKYRRSDAPKWPGALFTTVWWVSMTAGLPWALSQLGGYDLTYGSLAGVVVMLLFFYLIGLGLVFGAHLNAALAEPPEQVVEGAQQVE